MLQTDNFEFLTAHFSNNERTVATVYWGNKDETIEEIVKAEEDNPAWDRLLSHMDIDTLHEMTYKHIHDQHLAFEENVIRVAKSRGFIYDIDDINSDVYKLITKSLFKEFDSIKDKEKLFMLKLELFEIDKIRESKDREMKMKLRKAESIVEALSVACEIYLSPSEA